MIGFDQNILLELLMSGRLPPGLLGGSAATPGFGGPTMAPPPESAPETALPPTRPGLRDIWRGIGSQFEGVDLPPEVAATNRGRGMLDAGIALLAGAGRRPPGEAFATGLSAFRGGIDRESKGYLERRRENEDYDLRKRSTEEQISSSRASTDRAEAQETRDAARFGWDREALVDTRKSMESLVKDIDRIAGPDSDEARRARALLDGGPTKFTELEDFHQDVLGRKQAPEISDEATDAEIAKRKRLYAEDPQAVFDREMERRRTAAYEVGATSRGGLSDTSYLTQVRTRANQIYKAKVAQATKFGMTDPTFDHVQTMEESMAEAEQELASQGYSPRAALGTPGGPSSAPSVTEAEVQAVRDSLATHQGDEERVRQGLQLRGVPPEKIDELLRLAGAQ